MLRSIAGALVGVIATLALVAVLDHFAPDPDRCVAAAVRVYPTIPGRELVVSELDDCRGLDDRQLSEVRAQLQAFGMEAATRVAAGTP